MTGERVFGIEDDDRKVVEAGRRDEVVASV